MGGGRIKYKKAGNRFLLFLLFALIAINFVSEAYALDLPYPPDTELIEGGTGQYRSLLTQGKILQFYQRELGRKGWKIIDIPFQQPPGLTSSNRTFNFAKGSDTLVLTFSPFTAEGFVFYTISVIEPTVVDEPVNIQELSLDDVITEPESLSFMPIYPGSKQIDLSGPSDSIYIGYMVSGGIDEIKEFYLQGMPGYGWNLVNQKRINEKEYSLSEVESACPTCPKLSPQVGGKLTGPKISAVILEFKQEGKTCFVAVSKTENLSSFGAGNLTSFGLGDTIITIVYDDK